MTHLPFSASDWCFVLLLSLCSIFVYPALLTVAMTTLTFPKGTGQWLGGEVSPSVPNPGVLVPSA